MDCFYTTHENQIEQFKIVPRKCLKFLLGIAVITVWMFSGYRSGYHNHAIVGGGHAAENFLSI
jgi:hypothetical protein